MSEIPRKGARGTLPIGCLPFGIGVGHSHKKPLKNISDDRIKEFPEQIKWTFSRFSLGTFIVRFFPS
jgi:hypothetical protein